MRGKVHFLKIGLNERGITPAYAGKSEANLYYQTHGGGSPPRMRGKEGVLQVADQLLGITPACAGKRVAGGGSSWKTWDHPRVCGEKGFWTSIPSGLVGSPPRMRGKVQTVCPLAHLRRITPACAGKSVRLSTLDTGPRDHPRACGEKYTAAVLLALLPGSPPRMRGKDVRQELQHSGRGITPAYAGKSSCL